MAIDPRIWSGTPHKNQTAWLDLVGQIEFFIRALAQKTFALNGETVRVFPLGSGGGDEWMQGLHAQYVSLGRALNVETPDLAAYDLTDPSDFASWTFTLGQTTRALQNAAGLV